MRRAGILIDVDSMYRWSQETIGGNLDYNRTMEYVGQELGKRGSTPVYKLAYLRNMKDQGGFLHSLSASGIEYSTFPNNVAIAVALSQDAVDLASKVDDIVILSHEAGYIPLIEKLDALYGLTLNIYFCGFKESMHNVVKNEVDNFIWLGSGVKYVGQQHSREIV